MNNNNNPTTQTTLNCRNCGIVSKYRLFLHRVDPDNDRNRLCTSCVLKNNIGLFCPTCLVPIDDLRHVICRQCQSRSHRVCVDPHGSQKSTAFYTCPPCSNPNHTFFDLETRICNGDGNGGDGDGDDRVVNAFDKKGASAFLLATKIALNSMNKAAVLARKEAEKKVKEALDSRIKATEAFHRAGVFAARDRDQSTRGNHV